MLCFDFRSANFDIIVALYLDNRYLNAEDTEFVNLVTADIAHYQKTATPDRVLFFPPVESYYRLLIHRTADDFPDLCSFSIGAGDERRTIVCQQISILRAMQMNTWGHDVSENVEKVQRTVSMKQPRWGHDAFTQEKTVARPMGRGQAKKMESRYVKPAQESGWQHDDRDCFPPQSDGSPFSRTSEKLNDSEPEVTARSSFKSRRHSPVIDKQTVRNKGKRPDVQVYVPRAKRVQHDAGMEHLSDSEEPVCDRGDTVVATQTLPISKKHKQRPTVEPYMPKGRRMEHNKRVDSGGGGQSEEEGVGRRSESGLSEGKDVGQRLEIGQSEDKNVGERLGEVKNSWEEHRCDAHDIDVREHVNQSVSPELGLESTHDNRHHHHKSKKKREKIDDSFSEISNNEHSGHHKSKRKHHSKDRDGKDEHRSNSKDRKDKHCSKQKSHDKEHRRHHRKGSSDNANVENTEQNTLDNTNKSPHLSKDISTSKVYSECSDIHGADECEELDEKLQNVDSNLGQGSIDVDHCQTISSDGDPQIATNCKDAQLVKLDDGLQEHTRSDVEMENIDSKDTPGQCGDADNQQDVNLSQVKVHDHVNDFFHDKYVNQGSEKLQREAVECSVVTELCPQNAQGDVKDMEQDTRAAFDNKIINKECSGDGLEDGMVGAIIGTVCEKIVTGNSLVSEHCKVENMSVTNNAEHDDIGEADFIESATSDSIDQSERRSEMNKQTDDSIEIGDDLAINQSYQCPPQSLKARTPDPCTDTSQSEAVGELISPENSRSESMSHFQQQDYGQHEDVTPNNEYDTSKSESMIQISCSGINSSESNTNHSESPSQVTCPDIVQSENITPLDKQNASQSETAVHVAQLDLNQSDTAMEEDTWDTMYDDTGEALDSKMMDELTAAVGNVKVQKPQFDYYNYQPKDPEIDYEAYGHLIEIYDFPASLITRDLIVAFKEFQNFDIKWVDDGHAIGIFSSNFAARSALTLQHPLIKVRPLYEATRQTKLKAKKTSEFLQPFRPRPETVASVARNMVVGALGLRTKITKEKRDEERRILREAREKKKQSSREKKEAWNGSFGRCAMDDAS